MQSRKAISTVGSLTSLYPLTVPITRITALPVEQREVSGLVFRTVYPQVADRVSDLPDNSCFSIIPQRDATRRIKAT